MHSTSSASGRGSRLTKSWRFFPVVVVVVVAGGLVVGKPWLVVLLVLMLLAVARSMARDRSVGCGVERTSVGDGGKNKERSCFSSPDPACRTYPVVCSTLSRTKPHATPATNDSGRRTLRKVKLFPRQPLCQAERGKRKSAGCWNIMRMANEREAGEKQGIHSPCFSSFVLWLFVA